MAHPLPRPCLPRPVREAREHAGRARSGPPEPHGGGLLPSSRSRDLYLGSASRRVPARRHRGVDRPRAAVGDRADADMTAVAAKLGVYLRLGRVSNLPTVWTNVLAGVVLAGGRPQPRLLTLWTALSCFYVGGMFLNDAFDRQVDARERAEGPITSGEKVGTEVYGSVLLR